MDFYSALQERFDKFKELGKIFMLGDSNARLGSFLEDKDINGNPVSNKNKPLLLGFLDYTGLQVLNKVFAKGIATYEIINRKRSIIDICLTYSISLVRNFQILPFILGVDAQTCHKIFRLELFLDNYQSISPAIPKIKRFKHCSFPNLEKVRDFVYSKLEDIKSIREQCGTPFLPTYKQFEKLYAMAKENILGYVEPKNCRSRPIGPKIRSLQKMIRKATADVYLGGSDFEIFRLQNLERAMKKEYYRAKNERFSQWLGKLNTLDYTRRTRTFFRELSRKQRDTENFGPIKDSSGVLSKNLTECLETWATFYASLYRGTVSNSFNPPHRHNSTLDREFSYADVVMAVNTLKDHKAPGTDNILSDDFTILLCVDPEDDYSKMKNVELLKSFHVVMSSFWARERVPPSLKKSIIRPFLKERDKDQTDTANYRPISLLNTWMKVYEAMIKYRLVRKLDNDKFFSATQAAYRKSLSTADQIFALQELVFEYRFYRTGPRGGSKPPLYLCFLDFRKAFDTVCRDILFRKLYAIGITGKCSG